MTAVDSIFAQYAMEELGWIPDEQKIEKARVTAFNILVAMTAVDGKQPEGTAKSLFIKALRKEIES